MEFIAANPVEKLIIDLRSNGGGNNGLNRPVVIGLIKSKIDERGRLFVITGRQTFSAAQNFVNELEKYTNAIFIGEPTAGHPNHYGDNRTFTLPNSKLEARVSTLYWQDMDPRDARPWTAPEVAAELSSDDYRTGRDPVMQAVLEFTPGTSFTDLLNAAVSHSGITEFIAKYRAFKRDPRHKFVNTEAQLNRAGYDLLQQKHAADALELFKLNAESYPSSANVFDSLGDGYVAVGNKAEAIKSYEKALAIDPNYASSRQQLNRLKQSP
jgi:tetratricopeptide (TPR) repeat protein